MVDRVENYLLDLQDRICAALEEVEQKHCLFIEDPWQSKLGSGRTRVLSGKIFEKAGVNFSKISGNNLPAAATARHADLINGPFYALGVSVVIHPTNPYIPTVHCNVRFFIVDQGGNNAKWWFGGGYDLTPYYGFDEDCVHWHQVAKSACDRFNPDYYPRFKKWADDYFYLKHRAEQRGIGGLFFDDLNELSFDHSFAFMQSVGDSFLEAYMPIVSRRINNVYGEREKEFQKYRRGRYVEFNLIYDRGTLFGLQSGGRVESILMSLPPQVSWSYNWKPQPNSHEARLYEHYLIPQVWTIV